MATEGFALNNGVRIHYIDIIPDEDGGGIPLLVIPGMINSAEQYAEQMKGTIANRRTIFMSVRGRGQSDAPDHGYSFHEQCSDVSAVLRHLELGRVYIYGHSTGASFALGHAISTPKSVAGLIIGDFPPRYPPYPAAWGERVLANPHNTLAPAAVHGIVRDAREVTLNDELRTLDFPVLILRGGREGSLLPAESADRVKELFPNARLEVLEESGHDLFSPDPKILAGHLEAFMRVQEIPR